MSGTHHGHKQRSFVLPRHEVKCPHCAAEIRPSPFLGRALIQCGMCEQIFQVETDGVSFASSNVTASRLPGWRTPTLH